MSSDHDWPHNSTVNNEDREGCREMEFCDNHLNSLHTGNFHEFLYYVQREKNKSYINLMIIHLLYDKSIHLIMAASM